MLHGRARDIRRQMRRDVHSESLHIAKFKKKILMKLKKKAFLTLRAYQKNHNCVHDIQKKPQTNKK